MSRQTLENQSAELILEFNFYRSTVSEKDFTDFIQSTINKSELERIESLPSHKYLEHKYLTITDSRKRREEIGKLCKKCGKMTVYPYVIQVRRSDEPATHFTKCDNCGNEKHLGDP
jgi:DNA-directed RNA polymerase subunit M/transcription elongation factor TFIIS